MTKALCHACPSLQFLYTRLDTIPTTFKEGCGMQDFAFLAVILLFFVLSIGYTFGCDKL